MSQGESMNNHVAPRAAGKKVFITGAAGGLGAAMARMFARHGAKVFLTDIDADAVTAVAEEINRELSDTVARRAVDSRFSPVRPMSRGKFGRGGGSCVQ